MKATCIECGGKITDLSAICLACGHDEETSPGSALAIAAPFAILGGMFLVRFVLSQDQYIIGGAPEYINEAMRRAGHHPVYSNEFTGLWLILFLCMGTLTLSCLAIWFMDE